MTVSVGSPGTAPGNRFDPTMVLAMDIAEPVAGLDAAYYVGLGTVAFAVDERLNTVGVVSAAMTGPDRAGAERLAALIAPRLAAG